MKQINSYKVLVINVKVGELYEDVSVDVTGGFFKGPTADATDALQP
jgi:hypothetical protein